MSRRRDGNDDSTEGEDTERRSTERGDPEVRPERDEAHRDGEVDRDGEADRDAVAPLPADEPDFASEHSSVTVADQQPGGPEGVPERESPKGFAGMESRVIGRRRRGGT